MDSFVKKVTFKDDTGKMHSYIATFVKVDGGYKISDEDMQQINEAMHKGATWEDTSPEEKVDEDLEKKADNVKSGARTEAILKTVSDRQDDGEGLGKIIDELENAKVDTSEELQEKLHPGDELLSEEEKTALGNIVNAIRDRWQ